jgi:hypothetical protein
MRTFLLMFVCAAACRQAEQPVVFSQPEQAIESQRTDAHRDAPDRTPAQPARERESPQRTAAPQTGAAAPQPKPPAPELPRADVSAALAQFAPEWMAKDCGDTGSTGLRDAMGKKNVLVTHPLSANMPCIFGRRVDVLPDKKTTLRLVVGHHPEGDWLLSVTADRELVRKVIGKETAPDGWTQVDVDLSGYAGQIITVQLINASNPKGDHAHEEAYWASIQIE